jgi:hypothetical protein
MEGGEDGQGHAEGGWRFQGRQETLVRQTGRGADETLIRRSAKAAALAHVGSRHQLGGTKGPDKEGLTMAMPPVGYASDALDRPTGFPT